MYNTYLYIYQRWAKNEISYGCGISQGIAFPPQSLGIGKTPAEAKKSLFLQLAKEIRDMKDALTQLEELFEAAKRAPVVLDDSVESCYKTELEVQSLQPSPEGAQAMGTPSNEDLAQTGTDTSTEAKTDAKVVDIAETKPAEPDVSPAPTA